jgi:hypothetical protein
MIDRTTKILLGLIAFGLLANAAISSVSLIRPAIAADDYSRVLQLIESDLGRIQRGSCANSTICVHGQ